MRGLLGPIRVAAVIVLCGFLSGCGTRTPLTKGVAWSTVRAYLTRHGGVPSCGGIPGCNVITQVFGQLAVLSSAPGGTVGSERSTVFYINGGKATPQYSVNAPLSLMSGRRVTPGHSTMLVYVNGVGDSGLYTGPGSSVICGECAVTKVRIYSYSQKGLGHLVWASPTVIGRALIAPLMGKGQSQIVTTQWLVGSDAGVGILNVWNWQGKMRSVLALGATGPLADRLHRHRLSVTGEYLPNQNTCLACGQESTVLVAYHEGQWTGSPQNVFQEWHSGIVPPAPPTVTFGTGFDNSTFTLTGSATQFPLGSTVWWLLSDPKPFNSANIGLQLYQQQGQSETLITSNTLTVNPQDGEEADQFAYPLSPGTYQLVFVVSNRVLASGTFTIN